MPSERNPSPVAIEAGLVIGGKYRLDERLAEGGMGAVWRARHEVLDADVAVKLMSTEVAGTELALARFEREAKASAKLKSNHIVRVQDYGVDGDIPFMVMELLEGEDFGTRLKRDGPMALEDFVSLFRQAAKGLEVAHAAGFVHRDLKPSNLFIAREGKEEVLKVVDFGVARETKTKIVEDRTSSGVVLGSPHHMSPEQARGERVDHRSDLWSLAIVAFRALAGRKPFDSDVLATLLLEIVSKPVPKISDVAPGLPTDLDRFFSRGLNRNPDRRFQSATAMADALEAIAKGQDVTPYLTVPAVEGPAEDGEGREEATVPSLDPAAIPPAIEGPNERSASRALTAVTAGVPSVPMKKSRAWVWLALAAGVAGLAFFWGRAGSDGVPSPAANQTTTATATGAAALPTSEPTAEPVATAEPTASARPTAKGPEAHPSASASATTPPVVSQPAKPPGVVPRPLPPKPAPKIDPFTGLPTK